MATVTTTMQDAFFERREEGFGSRFGDLVLTGTTTPSASSSSRHRPSLSATESSTKGFPFPRKFSQQGLSTENISYPTLVSRTDAMASPIASSSFDSPPPQKTSPSSAPRRSLPSSQSNTFLAPLLERSFKSRFGKEKEKDGGKADGTGVPKKAKRRKSEEDARSRLRQNQEAFFAQFPEDGTTIKLNVNHTSRRRHDSSPNTKLDPVPVPSVDDLRFEALFPTIATKPPTKPSSMYVSASHRRATSCDESPTQTSSAVFEPTPPSLLWRATSAADEVVAASSASRTRSRSRTSIRPHHQPPVPSPMAPPPRSGSAPSLNHSFSNFRITPEPLVNHSRNASSQSTKSRPPSDAFYEPKTPTASHHANYTLPQPPRPSSDEALPRIGMMMRDAYGMRELPGAAYGSDGVVLTLRASQRPEDMEVAWSTTSGYDEEGRVTTQWELRIVPKAKSPSSAPTFADYRLNANLAQSAPLPSQNDSLSSPGSPRSSGAEALPIMAPTQIGGDERERYRLRERKASAATSDKTSGSSFSSESSGGPHTPRKTRYGMLSNASDQEFLDEVAVVSAGQANGSAKRVGRKSSYASMIEQHQRHTSQDEEFHRFGSFSMPGESPVTDKRSAPRNRFGLYIPGMVVDITSTPVVVSASDGESTFSPFLPQNDLSPTMIPTPQLSPPTHNARRLATHHQRSRSEAVLRGLSTDGLHADTDEEEELDDGAGPSASEIRKALARQKARIASHWSDTDGETDEEGTTSWSQVPDNDESC